MYQFHVILGGFDGRSLERYEARVSVIQSFIYALAKANDVWLSENPDAPRLYDSNIRYVEVEKTDDWCDIPEVLRRGYADCDDLAAWRLAELWREGESDAEPRADVIKEGNQILYHAFVARRTGLEDPAKIVDDAYRKQQRKVS